MVELTGVGLSIQRLKVLRVGVGVKIGLQKTSFNQMKFTFSNTKEKAYCCCRCSDGVM